MSAIHAIDIRTVIVDACERVLARVGYKKMTMEDVAAEAGLARRTLYLHFRAKEALATETIKKIVRTVLAAMESCLDERTGGEALRTMLVERIVSRLESVGAYHHSTDDIMRALHPHNTKFHVIHFE